MFYDNYKKLCDEHSEKPFALAVKLGAKSNASVANWQKGGEPRYELLSAIARYFGVSTDYLVFGEKKEPAPKDEDGLDPLDRRLVSLLPKLSQGQKKLLLTQLELTIQDDPE